MVPMDFWFVFGVELPMILKTDGNRDLLVSFLVYHLPGIYDAKVSCPLMDYIGLFLFIN